jgi:N-acetylmuramoyl-L-alanine amidase-like protein
MSTEKSTIATQVEGRTTSIVKRTPWGLCFHTTGSGITESAVYVRKKGKAKGKKTLVKRATPLKPIDVALKVYLASQNGSNKYPWGGPGYVIEHDGTIHQIAGDNTRTNHVGSIVEGHDRRKEYLSGKWLEMCSPAAVAQWNAHWGPKYKNSQQLFPSKYPNTDYIGVEMIPCGNGFGKPMRKGLRFTKEQHEAAVRLAVDVGRRNKFPDGWWRTPRLLGHEDVGLIDRHDKGGGWDPGWLRAEPYFDFEYVKEAISTRW